VTNNTIFPPGALVRVKDIVGRPKDGRPGLLPISERTWLNWVSAGRVPQGRKIGPKTRAWPIEVVMAVGEPAESAV
jgi:hypothetical protein